jgi:hypothetical protein
MAALKYIDSLLQAKTGLKLAIRDFEVQSVILRQKKLTDY